mgnify:CR=1 FL=1
MTVGDRTVVIEHVSKSYQARTHRRSLADLVLRAVARQPPSAPPRWVLRDVSFTLQPGESIGIIGRNGAGKSTLLKIVAGIARPSSGRVRVPMRVSAQFALGAGFNQALTGVENAYLQGTMLGLTNQQVRAKLPEIEAFTELGEAMRRPLWTYSTGMHARLAFALAAQAETELMLIDEALGTGDAAFRDKCRQVLADVRRRGRALIVVSHSGDALKSMCDRGLWLDHGTVREDGPIADVLAHYHAATVPAPA